LALSLSLAALIVAVGGFLAVLNRLDALSAESSETTTTTSGRPPGVVPPDAPVVDPLETDDLGAKLDWLVRRLQEADENAYDYYSDVSQDLFALKREVRQLKGTLRRIVQGIGRTPGAFGGGWGLVAQGTPIDAETAKRYREEAERFGVAVEEGRVTVRGFLNFSPDTRMPIEYFITRFPESGHETLVHLIGNKDMETLGENPYGALKGLATALYKGLVAAGFREGEPTHPDPNSDPKAPVWILASGDTVYIAVRYERGGETHVALATDWVLDPISERVLPPDCFRFTGSARGEDPDTGDEVLAAEAMGLLVSVWPSAAAMVEVSLESALRNDYTYNFSRIPKPEGEEALFLDVIFSKTPIEPEGEGAAPIDRPPSR
jgi:hypothetical protein